METAVTMYQRFLMYACLGALGAMAAAGLLCLLGVTWESVKARYRALDGVSKFFIVSIISFACLYGGSKVTMDQGLSNNGSYTTNDTVHIAWTKGPSLPTTATVYIDYRPNGNTNVWGETYSTNWVNLAETPVMNLQWDGTVPGATNYDYFVWAYYAVQPTVHTNGVWVGYGGQSKDGFKYITVGGIIKDGDKVIANPQAKRLSTSQENQQ